MINLRTLFYSEKVAEKEYSSLLSFTVPDINNSVTKLIALGAELDGPIKYEIYGKVAAVRCIDGHMVGLYEPAWNCTKGIKNQEANRSLKYNSACSLNISCKLEGYVLMSIHLQAVIVLCDCTVVIALFKLEHLKMQLMIHMISEFLFTTRALQPNWCHWVLLLVMYIFVGYLAICTIFVC